MKIVIDSGILMNTNYLPNFQGDLYIPFEVLNELKSSLASNILDILISKHHITVVDPNIEFVNLVRDTSNDMGQNNLSPADVEVLALAMQLSHNDYVMIFSDDYAVRNVAHQLEIESFGVTTQGGDEKRLYGYSCRACGKAYNHFLEECEICGHIKFRRFRRS